MSEEELPRSQNAPAGLTRSVQGAQVYCPSNDISVVTCYFNSSNYETKSNNFSRFLAPFVNSGIDLTVVECAFDDSGFVLKDAANIFRIRSPDILWQKERLLNLAISRLPSHVQKVVWVDCDVLFENPNWLVETSRLLDQYPVVQPFDTAIRLPRGHQSYEGTGEAWKSFAAVYERDPDLLAEGDFHSHGHTGFAWGARRELITQNGLYDALISGSGDHFMAHGMCGDFDSRCFERLPLSKRHRSHFLNWGAGMFEGVQGRISALPGILLHLWHGDTSDRGYVLRHAELAEHDFDPISDIGIGPEGAWEWKNNKPDLHRWAIDYFYKRKEDGASDVGHVHCSSTQKKRESA